MCFCKGVPKSQCSVFAVALLPADFLSALTAVVLYTKNGGDVEEGLSERKKCGLREETAFTFLNQHSHHTEREPSRDHDLSIFIFCKFICCNLRKNRIKY